MSGPRYIPVNLAANSQQAFSVDGDTVFVFSATGTLVVEWDGLAPIPLSAGTGIKAPRNSFNRFTVTDTSGAPNTVRLYVGYFDLISGIGSSGTGGGSSSGTLPASSSVTPLGVDVSSAFVAFAATACTRLDLINSTGVDIEYQRGGAGETIVVPAYGTRLVLGITNASQIAVRRVDLVATAVRVKAEAFA